MATCDASTAPAPAASMTDPPVSSGAKRFPRALAAGLAHCTEPGDGGGGRFRRLPAHGARPLPAVAAHETPGVAAFLARPSGPPDPLLHP